MTAWRWLVRAGATLVTVGLVSVLVQPVRVRVEAAVTVADALDVPVARPFAASVERRPATLAGVVGDLYTSGGRPPAVVLVPGATPLGRDDPRVGRLAGALARSERDVFVPALELYDGDLVSVDVDRIVRAAAALAARGHDRVMLLGISFGGSLCLLAAADGRLDDGLAGVATFGAYFDLVGLVQAATTGVSLVDGQRVPWDADPRAYGIVRDRLIELLPPAQRTPARQALDGDRDPAGLPPAAQDVYRLVTNRDPARTSGLAARLPAAIRDRLARMSPSSVTDRLRVPIVAMHASDDPAVPYGELGRLGAALPHAQLITVDSFDHIDLELTSPGGWLRATDDLWNAWRFATTVLDRQDGWWP